MRVAGAAATSLVGAALIAGSIAGAARAASPVSPSSTSASVSPSGSVSPSASASAASSAPPPATAITGHIASRSSVAGVLQITLSATGLAQGQTINLASVQVSLNGTPIGASATAITGSASASTAPAVARTAVLVVDVSGSMAGASLDAAKQAAQAFLDAVPPDVKVGLVTVSTTATVAAAPTTDRSVVATDVSHLVARGNTALYDGTLLAEQLAGATGSRTILLLTDGRDDVSKSTLAAAVASARASGAVLDAVSLGTSASQLDPLMQLTSASGGRLLATQQVTDFAPAFRRAAQDIAAQVLITAQIPPSFDGQQVTISVKALAGGVPVSASAPFTFAPAPIPATSPAGAAASAAASPAPAAQSPVASSAAALALPPAIAASATPLGTSRLLAILGIFGLFVGLAALLFAAGMKATVLDTRGTRVRRRLSFYTLTGRGSRADSHSTVLGDSTVARSAVQFAGQLVVSRELDARLGRRLDGAGVPLKPAEWIVVQASSAIGLAVLFALLGGGSLVAAVLGLLIGIGAPIGYLIIKEGRRSIAFLEQLPDTLQLIAGSLSVGHSLPQAMDAVVREERQPVSVEFNRALVETRLGMPVEDALEGISTRMASEDFGWIVMAIRIQREVGGNLAEVLTTVAATIRERERLRRQVRGLSAEGRLSAWILGGMPPIFATYLILVRPNYIRPLFTDPIGILLLIIAVILMITGAFWLSRLVKVKV